MPNNMKIILTMPRSLLVGGNHIFHLYLFNICIRLLFFRLQIQNFPCSGRGVGGVYPPPRPRNRSVHSDLEEIIFHLYLFNICIRKLFFQAPNSKFSPARSLRCLASGPFTWIFETPQFPKHPGYGPVIRQGLSDLGHGAGWKGCTN